MYYAFFLSSLFGQHFFFLAFIRGMYNWSSFMFIIVKNAVDDYITIWSVLDGHSLDFPG